MWNEGGNDNGKMKFKGNDLLVQCGAVVVETFCQENGEANILGICQESGQECTDCAPVCYSQWVGSWRL